MEARVEGLKGTRRRNGESGVALLPYMSVYEWRILMYLLGPKELVRRGSFEIFGTLMPEWTPEMVLTYQVMCAG